MWSLVMMTATICVRRSVGFIELSTKKLPSIERKHRVIMMKTIPPISTPPLIEEPLAKKRNWWRPQRRRSMKKNHARKKVVFKALGISALMFAVGCISQSAVAFSMPGQESQVIEQLLAPGARRDSLTLLLTTATVIPFVKALGLSPILGFLAAGVALGPQGLGVVTELSTTEALAELGVVFFLFEMGLELSIEKLQAMRKEIFGLGLAQFGLTSAGLAAILCSICGLKAAIIVGGALALSSSAFVLQLLRDKDELGTSHGRASLGVLLLQDLAVVPLLVLTPLLAQEASTKVFVGALVAAAIKAIGAVLAVEMVFKKILDKAFARATMAGSQEAFLAVALLAVLGVSAFTASIGLSDTLGAFLAGIALSETRYSRKVEADVAPFRGMLLGLFFVTVGFSMDVKQILATPLLVLSLAGGLCVFKATVLGLLAIVLKVPLSSAIRSGFLLAQGGEFGFVAFGLAERFGLLSAELAKLLVTTVAVSMAATPAFAALGDFFGRAIDRRTQRRELAEKCNQLSAQAVDDVPNTQKKLQPVPNIFKNAVSIPKQIAMFENAQKKSISNEIDKAVPDVIVVGYGRLGKVVCELLDAKLHRYVVVERDEATAIKAREEGRPVFVGDFTQPQTLDEFRCSSARLVVIACTDLRATNSLVVALRRLIRENDGIGPEIIARAADISHRRHLLRNGVKVCFPKLNDDSRLLTLPFAGAVLRGLGFRADDVDMLIEDSRRQALGGSYTTNNSPPLPASIALATQAALTTTPQPGQIPSVDDILITKPIIRGTSELAADKQNTIQDKADISTLMDLIDDEDVEKDLFLSKKGSEDPKLTAGSSSS